MQAVIDLVRLASTIYSFLILARVIMSWVQPDPRNPVVNFIYRLTEPVLAPVRSILPAMAGLDFSPILVLIGIQVLESLLVRALLSMAM